MSDKKLLQQFVDSFQRFDDMIAPENTPLDLIVKQDAEEWDNWRDDLKWHPTYIETSPDALDSLYARIAGRFPVMYKQLLLSYRWLEVDLKIIRLLANLPGPELSGLAEAIFKDRVISDVLIPAGFVQFAKAPDFNYDPVCFDLNAMSSHGDCPIIQFEHESLLRHSKIGEQWRRWDSFRNLVNDVVFS